MLFLNLLKATIYRDGSVWVQEYERGKPEVPGKGRLAKQMKGALKLHLNLIPKFSSEYLEV